jgi:aldoxime dehydratase
VTFAYWDDRATFDGWFPIARGGWTGDQRTFDGAGTFIEVLYPSVQGYETLFSSLGRSEGVAVLADSMSGEVQEHAYWGGMRDRIALSQTSEMAPADSPRAVRDGSRIRVIPHDNLCLIRSGQDWGDTESSERTMSLDDVEPDLREGMEFLRDDGRSIGCYANRLYERRCTRRRDHRKILRHELVEESRGTGTLGRIAPDPCRDFWRRHEVSLDPGARRQIAALS